MKGLIIVLSILLAGWMAGSTYYYTCELRGLCSFEGGKLTATSLDKGLPANQDSTSGDSLATIITYPMPAFGVVYKGDSLFKSPSNFRFAYGKVTPAVSPELKKAMDSIALFMKDNPEKTIEITGYYEKKEKNPSEFQNLGLARANFFAQALLDNGVEPARIINSFKRQKKLKFDSYDSLNGGIDLTMVDVKLDTAINKEIEEALKAESKVVYFEYNSDELILTDSLRDYINKTIIYLNQNANERLELIGHTDDTGGDDFNYKLGLNRAKTVQNYFRDFRANPNQIKVSSKGKRKPIVPNTSDENKAKNRRVEIKLSK